MFAKSRLAAVRLSGIAILCTAAGHMLAFAGLFWLEGGDFTALEPLPPLPVLLLAVFLIGVIVLLSGWTLARFISLQPERYFSRQGALLWALTGLLFGSLVGATTRLIARPHLEFFASLAVPLYLVEMVAAYALVFSAPEKIRRLVKRWLARLRLPLDDRSV
jgi:hypothetical protein